MNIKSVIKYSVLLIVSISIIAALVASSICSGPIDQIFPGVRDLTKCAKFGFEPFRISTLSLHTNTDRDKGVVVLLSLVFILILFCGLFLLIKKVIHKFKSNN